MAWGRHKTWEKGNCQPGLHRLDRNCYLELESCFLSFNSRICHHFQSQGAKVLSLKILVFFTPFLYLIYYYLHFFFFANNKEHCCSQEAFLTSLKSLTDSINQIFRQCLIRCFVLYVVLSVCLSSLSYMYMPSVSMKHRNALIRCSCF